MKITNPNKQIKKRKTVKGVVREVRRLLSDFDNWVQEDWKVKRDDGTFCYCLNGAIDAVAVDKDLATQVKEEVGGAIPRGFQKQYVREGRVGDAEEPIIDLNDGAFHKTGKGAWKAILRTLDRAIAA